MRFKLDQYLLQFRLGYCKTSKLDEKMFRRRNTYLNDKWFTVC
jgi:hypothetical protein